MINNKTNISLKQLHEFGILLAICLFILSQYHSSKLLMRLQLVSLVLTLLCPSVFRYPALGWMKLGSILNFFSSKIMLGLIFYLMVVPIGMIRKAFGLDSMRLKQWRKSSESIFIDRNHEYTSGDFDHMF